MSRLTTAAALTAVQSILAAGDKTYTMALSVADPGTIGLATATISTAVGAAGTVTITTSSAHGLTSGFTTSFAGISAGAVATALNGNSFTVTVTGSSTFTVANAATGSATGGTCTVGEVTGGVGTYGGTNPARQTVAFPTVSGSQISTSSALNYTNMPAISAPGSGIPTLYALIFDNSGVYVCGAATNIVNTAIAASATVQFASGQVNGQFS